MAKFLEDSGFIVVLFYTFRFFNWIENRVLELLNPSFDFKKKLTYTTMATGINVAKENIKIFFVPGA